MNTLARAALMLAAIWLAITGVGLLALAIAALTDRRDARRYAVDTAPAVEPLTVDEREWETELAAASGSRFVDLEWWLRNQGGAS